MKIAFDATSLCRKMTGIEHYSRNLLENLLIYAKDNEFDILFRNEIPEWIKPYLSDSVRTHLYVGKQLICEQLWIPKILKRIAPDIAHFPAFPPGYFVSTKHSMTVHDATMWRYPETTSLKNKLYMKPLTALALKRAKSIITVSNFSKGEIAKYTNVNETKITNTHQSLKPIKTVENPQRKCKEDYILAVGSIEPRKNLITLIKAYHILKERGFTKKLLLIGRPAWGNSSLYSLVKTLGLTNEIEFTGYISDEELIEYYTYADLFVFPSLYEGFGLPPLEAMACGTPVLSSDAASLPEVLGDACEYASPDDINEWSDKIFTICNSEHQKSQMAKDGVERSKYFSWEKTVNSTIDAFKKAIG